MKITSLLHKVISNHVTVELQLKMLPALKYITLTFSGLTVSAVTDEALFSFGFSL